MVRIIEDIHDLFILCDIPFPPFSVSLRQLVLWPSVINHRNEVKLLRTSASDHLRLISALICIKCSTICGENYARSGHHVLCLFCRNGFSFWTSWNNNLLICNAF